MRALKWLGGLVALALALLAGVYLYSQSQAGRDFVAARIARLAPENGLRIRIGRIEGSIFGAATLHDVRLADTKGVFFTAPLVRLDWRPVSWRQNRLDVRSLDVPQATLLRQPALVASTTKGPILPDFDIRVDRLTVGRLDLAEGVAGPARAVRLAGRADIADGRAVVALDGAAIDGGDRLRLALDAVPDGDRFDATLALQAPRGGVIGGLAGIDAPLSATIAGKGSWQRWTGRLSAMSATAPVADLALRADAGRYGATGTIAPARFLTGAPARLLRGPVRVEANGTAKARRIDGALSLSGPAISATGKGIVDLAYNRFEGLRVDAALRDPSALARDMRGRDVRASALLDGQFARARVDYLVQATSLSFGTTTLERLRASGQGRLSGVPMRVPLRVTAARVVGVGEVAGGILANLRADGTVRIGDRTISVDPLRVRSDRLDGRVALAFDLPSGRYTAAFDGALPNYLIPGLGLVDLASDVRVVPAGRTVAIAGTARVVVRRLDNGFFRSLTGTGPTITTRIARRADGRIDFTGVRIASRDLRVTGNGYRRADGRIFFEGSGTQANYGPVRVTVDGALERPRVVLALARPLPAAGVRDVRATLTPTPAGYRWVATGQSTIGAFTGDGAVLLPRNGAAVIRIGALSASGLTVAGDLTPAAGGLQGMLRLNGSGLNGTLGLRSVGGAQAIDVAVVASNMQLAGYAARSGAVNGTVRLGGRGVTADLTVTGAGVRAGNLVLRAIDGRAALVDGRGTVTGRIAGTRGRPFVFDGRADVTPTQIAIRGEGTVDTHRLSFTTPAILNSGATGWTLAPTELAIGTGRATVGGRFGGSPAIDASVTQLPLSVFDVIDPTLGLGGVASGTVRYASGAGGLPTGRIDLRVRSLTRAGLVLASTPVDIGVAGVLDARSAGVRAVAATGGQTIGQAQAQITGLAASGALIDRLRAAPVKAQLRYKGAADTLWRLTGVTSLDLSGPVAVGADVAGTIAAPRIDGVVRPGGLRLESPVSGTVLTNLTGDGRFDGSRLVFPAFTAKAGEGTIAGRATIELAGGLGLSIDAQATQADLIRRDDLEATVTGPLTVRSAGSEGRITGDLVLDRSAFRLGQADAAADVPQLNVREIGREDEPAPPPPPVEWALDIAARADNRLRVTGLGLDSEWSTAIKIGGTLSDMRIAGRADVVRGGYEFAGKRFELTRGVIRFPGDGIVPILDIQADTTVDQLSASVRVTGTALAPDIAFTSVPALPQEELLARLLFGTSITTLSAPEALQLAAAVASLRGGSGGLNPINALRDAIGLDRLRILPADATTGASTSLAAGKYITRRIFAEIISDGQGYSATRVEFQITSWLSLLSSISTIGRTNITARVAKDY